MGGFVSIRTEHTSRYDGCRGLDGRKAVSPYPYPSIQINSNRRLNGASDSSRAASNAGTLIDNEDPDQR